MHRQMDVYLVFQRCDDWCVHAHVQLILEEFGKWVKPDSAATQAERDAFYTLVYQAVQMVCLYSLWHATPA